MKQNDMVPAAFWEPLPCLSVNSLEFSSLFPADHHFMQETIPKTQDINKYELVCSSEKLHPRPRRRAPWKPKPTATSDCSGQNNVKPEFPFLAHFLSPTRPGWHRIFLPLFAKMLNCLTTAVSSLRQQERSGAPNMLSLCWLLFRKPEVKPNRNLRFKNILTFFSLLYIHIFT